MRLKFGLLYSSWIELMPMCDGGLPHDLYHVPLPQLILNLKDFINTPKEKAHGFHSTEL